MKYPHFFIGKSRLGILDKPYNQKENNHGVEKGGEFILNENFLSKIDKFDLTEYTFPLPEEIDKLNYFNEIAKSINEFSQKISKNILKDQLQIVIGGDHIITFASLIALLERVDPKDICYVHFDSHGDINQFSESPSGNFHGMYLRALFDEFELPEIDVLVKKKMLINNAIFIGNLDLDEGERKYFKKNKIKTINSEVFSKEKENSLQIFTDFISKFKYLHVSFDADVLDGEIFPATGIPAKNGMSVEDVMSLIEIILTHPNLSFDFSEFNPNKKGWEKSLFLSQSIIKKVL